MGVGSGFALRIFVELAESGRVLLPVVGGGIHVGLLLVEVLPRGELVHVHGVEHHLLQFLGGVTAGELVAVAQLLGYGGHYLVVALALAHGQYRLLLYGDAGEVRSLPGGGDYVLHLKGGVGRQDHVGVQAVVLQPRMLG